VVFLEKEAADVERRQRMWELAKKLSSKMVESKNNSEKQSQNTGNNILLRVACAVLCLIVEMCN